MAAVNASDYSIATNGDIRYTGSGTNNTVIEFHRWLGLLMDDAQASGDDIIDITDSTASERSTDNIITLNAPYNIDDTVAQHLYDGSIVQKNGDEIYDGILVFAPANTPLQILQNGAPAYPNFWGTGINADATSGISHRFMLKVRTAVADIDGRRLVGQTREVGFTYSEFKIATGTARGNNVLALNYASDLNNATAISTIAGWTGITNTEGYRLLDVDNDTANEPYYSEWNTNQPTRTINQFYERHKWLHRESTIEDSCADTGSNFAVGDATIDGQAQSFQNGANAQYLTRVRVNMKKVLAPTGNLTAVLYANLNAHGGGDDEPTGGALATSVNFDVATLTTAYLEYEIAFTTQYEMVASTDYCIAFEYTGGDASNYVHIEGLATSGTHSGNRSQLVAASWAPTAGDDLGFEVYASPKQYKLPGEVFRGVTHEVVVNNPTGTFSAVAAVAWSSGTGRMLAIDSVTAGTKLWMQLLTGVAPTDTQTISATGATCTVNTTVTERTLSQPPVGASTGTAIVGAYGLGIETADLTKNDKLTDLNTDLNIPPNNVTFTVSGLINGKDRVLVAPLGYTFAYDTEAGGPFSLGAALNFSASAGTGYLSAITDDGTTGRMTIRLLTGSIPKNNTQISVSAGSATAIVNGAVSPSEDSRQLILNTTLSGLSESAVVATATIPTDTPSTGDIRVELDSGIFREVTYTSYSASTFVIDPTDFSGDQATGGAGEAGNSIYVSYVDLLAAATTAAFTSVYDEDRSLFIRVRDGVDDADGPIKTFETTGVLTTAGGSATAIRTSDK